MFAQVCRTREADIARLNAEMDGLRAQLRATQGQLADTSASYKAAQGKVGARTPHARLAWGALRPTSFVGGWGVGEQRRCTAKVSAWL